MELIQQYLRGELDAKAMHRLEREAQDDPFLMEAIEGYQSVRKDQQSNLNELSERFERRTGDNHTRNIIIWRVLPAAATLLIALGIGFLWFKPNLVE